MVRANVYLDIDGVLLANEKNMANFCHDFLAYVTDHFDVYWLTTHCRGDAQYTVNHLSAIMPPDTLALARKIKPTNWTVAKTEAINFEKPFLWFDDDLFEDERDAMIEQDALDNWIEVDLSKDENQLKKFVVGFPFPVVSGKVIEIR